MVNINFVVYYVKSIINQKNYLNPDKTTLVTLFKTVVNVHKLSSGVFYEKALSFSPEC